MECLICRGSLLPDEKIRTCEGCNSIFHLECWAENSGCGTPGCINLPAVSKKQEGAKKICPACSEEIDLCNMVCPYCNEKFDTIAPLTIGEHKGIIKKSSQNNKEGKNPAIAILVFGLLGFTAPINLIFGGIWYQKNKNKLKESSPIYNILSIVGLSVSTFYSVLILIGILIG